MDWKKLKTMNRNEWIKNTVLYLMGVIFGPMGAVLTINAHLGASGYDALNFAVADKLHISVSNAVTITAFIVLCITACIRRSYPRIETFVTSFLQGLCTNFWNELLADIQGTDFVTSLIILLVGLLIISVGAGCYMLSVFPTNAIDDVVVAMREKKVSIPVSKISTDGVCVTLAFLLGGEIGFGTIICTAALGPMINISNKMVSGLLHRSNRKVIQA